MSEIAVDTSAFVALFKGEPRTDALQSVLSTVSLAVVPATCLVELALLRRVDGNLLPWASSLVSNPPYRVVETTLAEAGIAVDAALRFGKGSGHPAKLNFGDCLVYAAAKHRNLPLLFVGDDFHLTDLKPALTRG